MNDKECLLEISRSGPAAEEAARMLYQRYAKRFTGWVRSGSRSFDHHDAEDIVQDAFVNLFRNTHHALEAENTEAYIWQILRNSVVDFLRRSMRSPDTVPDCDDDGGSSIYERYAGEDDPLGMLELDCVVRVLESFERLHPELGLVVSLQHFYGLSLREISEAIGKGYDSTRQLASAAKRALIGKLVSECLSPL